MVYDLAWTIEQVARRVNHEMIGEIVRLSDDVDLSTLPTGLPVEININLMVATVIDSIAEFCVDTHSIKNNEARKAAEERQSTVSCLPI